MADKTLRLPGSVAPAAPIDPVQEFLQLKAAADRGDPRAKAKLARVTDFLAAAQIARAPQPVQQEEEVLGEEQVLQRAAHMDRMDAAEFIEQSLPYADDLHRKALLRKAHQAGLEEQAPFSRINPPSVLKGIIGNQQVVSAGGAPAQVAFWPGDDAENIPVTCTFAPSEQLSQVGFEVAATARPFGIVQWGTKGMMVRAEVDIGTGIQFTIGASQVTLQVAMDPQRTSDKTVGRMKLAGMLSFHPVIRFNPITRTVYLEYFSGGGGGPTIIPIPAFAKTVFWPAVNVAVGGFIEIDQLDVNRANVAPYQSNVATATNPATMPGPILLTGDAVFVRVNAGVGGVIFGLEL